MTRRSGGNFDFVDSGAHTEIDPKDAEKIREGYRQHHANQRRQKLFMILMAVLLVILMIWMGNRITNSAL